MGELAASCAVHLLLREAGAGAGGNIPSDWYKTPHYRPCVCAMCTLLYYSCCGAADKLSPREREVRGAVEGKLREVGGLSRARRGGIDTNGD